MSQQYPMLTYPGNLLRDGHNPTGGLLGWDEMFRLYEIADIETYGPGDDGEHCPHNDVTHSHVFLQYATADTMREHGEAFRKTVRAMGLLP